MCLNTTVWILSNQHLQGNEMQSKDQDFFKGVICRIIRLTGNCSVLWENLQVVEKFTEWNIHYLLISSRYLSNSATQWKHCLVPNNIRQTHKPSVLGTFYRKAQDFSLCLRHPSHLCFPALCLLWQKEPWLAQHLPQSDHSKQMEKDEWPNGMFISSHPISLYFLMKLSFVKLVFQIIAIRLLLQNSSPPMKSPSNFFFFFPQVL